MAVCLSPAFKEIGEVVIGDKQTDWYSYLLALRDKNLSPLDQDTVLHFRFHYRCASLSGDTLIDRAEGIFTVPYKDHVFPFRFLKGGGVRISDFTYAYDSTRYADSFMEHVRYEHMPALLGLYNLMDQEGLDRQWKRIKQQKQLIRVYETEQEKVFSIYRKESLHKRITFSGERLKKIEWFFPEYMFRNNYREGLSDFSLLLAYTDGLPQIPYYVLQHYEVTGPVPYRMELVRDAITENLQLKKPDKFMGSLLLEGHNTFYFIDEHIRQARKEGKLK